MITRKKLLDELLIVLVGLSMPTFCLAADGTLVTQDCDGCTAITGGYQYPCLGPDPEGDYELWNDNWNCDVECDMNIELGDIDPEWSAVQSGVELNGCDGCPDTATLTYTSARTQEYNVSGGANWSVLESLGVNINFEISESSTFGESMEKPVSCSACQRGTVTPREIRRKLNCTVTMTAEQDYDSNVWEYDWEDVGDPPQFTRVRVHLVSTTPNSIGCGSDDAYWTNIGYNYYMTFDEDFEACPDNGQSSSPCIPKDPASCP